jgi:putative membrane protein
VLGLGRPPSTAGRGGGEAVRTRDHLANVRTFLAWTRVGLALVGLGYVVDRFDLLEQSAHHRAVSSHPESRALGLAMVVLGGVVCLGGFVRFLAGRRMIERASFRPRPSLDAALTVVAVLAGGIFLGYLIHVGG